MARSSTEAVTAIAPAVDVRTAVAPDELLRLLYRQVAALAGPRRELDDIVQVAAERALRSLPDFQGRSALSTWTYRIAYCAVVDHDRWYQRFRRRFVFAADSEVGDPPQDWDGEAAVAELHRARRLHVALAKLSPKRRAVVVLHDLEGLPLREVATIVNCKERTAVSRLRDARKALVKLLSADRAFQEGCP